MRKDQTKPDPPSSIRIGGKDLHPGQTLSLAEAEELMQRILQDTEGPVTIEQTDASSGLSSRVSVDKWADFAEGPKTNSESHSALAVDLQAKGYLAFRQDQSGRIEYETPFRALTPQYFREAERFVRCQDVPGRYLRPISPQGQTWFVSHRWLTPSHPDPSGEQFRLLQRFLMTLEADSIWYDFSCLPQEPLSTSERSLFRESVKNLNSLVIASNFLAIPTADYMTRAWCYYEWAVAELLCTGKRAITTQTGTTGAVDEQLKSLVLEGMVPQLNVTQNADMPAIEALLLDGVRMFKTLALTVTLEVLNDFGFAFGVGIAARFAERMDFSRLWIIWQVLAGSSQHSGIRLPELLNKERLKSILLERHEHLGTHAKMFQQLKGLAQTHLDMRIVEQQSHEHLTSLMVGAQRAGVTPSAYTPLALITLVYAVASTQGDGQT